MKKTVQTNTKRAAGGFRVESSVRGFTMVCDEPLDAGGTDTGMTPVEALLCSLGSCITIAAYIFAEKKGVNLKGFSVDIDGDLDADGFLGLNEEVRKGFSEIRLRFHVDSDDAPEKIDEFVRFVEKRCPVSDSIAQGVPIICEKILVN